jgi:hypothetical protein
MDLRSTVTRHRSAISYQLAAMVESEQTHPRNPKSSALPMLGL